jgi:hypothetical protein
MANARSSDGASKGKDARVPFEIMIGGERLAATPEGIGWVLKWRGDERAVDAGELVVLEEAEGKWWRIIVPTDENPSKFRPKLVPSSFRNSDDAKVVEWQEPVRFDPKSRLGDPIPTFTVGRCGPALRERKRRAQEHEEDRLFIRARTKHSRCLAKTTRAAIALRDRLADLCEAENERPWISDADGRDYVHVLCGVPNSRRQRGSLPTVESIRGAVTFLLGKLQEWQAKAAQRRGHPSDIAIAAVETPLRGMGLSDSEIAQQRQFCGLEVVLIDRPDRRLKGAGYAREKSRDHRRPRRGGTRKRSK